MDKHYGRREPVRASFTAASNRSMRRWLGAVVCLCLVLLAGCGNGTGSAPTTWHYTALGDSLAVGVLDSQGGYVRRYDNYIATDTGMTVTLTNLGVNGAHSTDLLKSLESDPTFRSAVSASQVVTWDIGGDDLLHARNQPFSEWPVRRRRQSGLLALGSRELHA